MSTAPGDDLGERRLRQLGLDGRAARRPGQPRARRRPRRARRDARDLAPAPTQAEVPTPGATRARRAPGDRRRARSSPCGDPTGAPGRSTVALNLAAELAVHAPTLLVDCDTYGSSVAQSLGLLDEAPGMAAACRAADQGALDLAGPGAPRARR